MSAAVDPSVVLALHRRSQTRRRCTKADAAVAVAKVAACMLCRCGEAASGRPNPAGQGAATRGGSSCTWA